MQVKFYRPDNSLGRPTKQELLGGLINSAYGDALKNLYTEDLINEDEFEKGLGELPEYLQDRTRKRAYE